MCYVLFCCLRMLWWAWSLTAWEGWVGLGFKFGLCCVWVGTGVLIEVEVRVEGEGGVEAGVG